jgi:hypothetical protein
VCQGSTEPIELPNQQNAELTSLCVCEHLIQCWNASSSHRLHLRRNTPVRLQNRDARRAGEVPNLHFHTPFVSVITISTEGTHGVCGPAVAYAASPHWYFLLGFKCRRRCPPIRYRGTRSRARDPIISWYCALGLQTSRRWQLFRLGGGVLWREK